MKKIKRLEMKKFKILITKEFRVLEMNRVNGLGVKRVNGLGMKGVNGLGMKGVSGLGMSVLAVSFISGVLVGCSPKVYLIDRQTVLEEEAAGEWPEFEKELATKSKSEGPIPFPKTEVSAKNSRLYNILNGEVASQDSTQTIPGSKVKAKANHEAKLTQDYK